ncbi:MAG TPA: flagellar hook protein FlgE [Caulobacteraceae bacterium]|jgi:flagellar hook protein FlgE
MSINSAMLAGVTGLTANASALAATSDNIANVNTVGYKRAQTNFSDLVTAASAQDYSAGGVTTSTTSYVTQQGLMQSTSSPTDLAISGSGFFVTTQSPTDVSATSPRLFTRAGSFTVDSQGYLKNSAGLYLQGWLADTSGNINTDPSNIALLQPINVSTVGGAAGATTNASINANLNAGQTMSQSSIDSAGAAYAAAGTIPANADPAAAAVATAIMGGGAVPADAYSPTSATTSMTAYNATTGTGTKPDFSVTIPLADSQGGARSMQIDYLKSDAGPNQWYAEAHVVPASDVTSGSPLIPGQVSTGIVSFTPDGRLDPNNTTLFGMSTNGGNASISFGASNAAAPGAGQVNWAPGLGINGQTVALTLGSAAGGMTQYDSQSIVQSVSTNGTPFGNLTSISIDSSGYVTAAFDNGVTRRIAQVAVATFPNPDGLSPVSGDAYRVSLDSGTYNLKAPGTGGAGSISPSSLEASTVDLSSEFSSLITTQQAYSASSKIITTADQMMQDLINVIR